MILHPVIRCVVCGEGRGQAVAHVLQRRLQRGIRGARRGLADGHQERKHAPAILRRVHMQVQLKRVDLGLLLVWRHDA